MVVASSHGTELTSWRDEELEAKVLESVSLDLPWPVVERFSKIVRLSGMPGEREAVEIITGHLDQLGISYTLHQPVCFISLPLKGTVRAIGGRSVGAQTSAMSVSTRRRGSEGV